MEFKRKVIGEMCNKYYKLVVIVFILCYNGVFVFCLYYIVNVL